LVFGEGGDGLDFGGGAGAGKEDLGSWDDVLGPVEVVDVEDQTGVFAGDMAGDGGLAFRRDRKGPGLVALDVELGAARVELGINKAVRDILKGDNLRADKVFAPWQVRKIDAEEAFVSDELLGGVSPGRGVIALLPDLEPPVTSGGVVKVGDGLHVEGDGTLVGIIENGWLGVIGISTELKGQFRSRGSRASKVHRLPAVSSACHIRVAVGRGNGAAGGGRIARHSNTRRIALRNIVDVDVGKDRVGTRQSPKGCHQGQWETHLPEKTATNLFKRSEKK
jgi:hypothetical protein